MESAEIAGIRLLVFKYTLRQRSFENLTEFFECVARVHVRSMESSGEAWRALDKSGE